MKFVALVSGGKDSFYSIMECIRNDHDLIACAHLSPRQQNIEEEESYMYQTAGSECIRTQVEECLGVPLVIRECVGRSKNTSLVYDCDHTNDQDGNKVEVEDEVEDLYELLVDIKRKFPSVQAISSGAILSTYQRTRIESVCSRLGLTSLGYMWRMAPQRNLLECMLKDGLEAVLVKVASPPGLMPRKHLNKTLGALFYGGVFDKLKDRFDFHICGEGGEYETLVLDCPIFRKKLVLTEIEIQEGDDGVGILKVMKCCSVEKEDIPSWQSTGSKLYDRLTSDESEIVEKANGFANINAKIDDDDAVEDTYIPNINFLPYIRILPGGLAHVSELVSHYIPRVEEISSLETGDIDGDIDIDAELAVLEAKSVFTCLGQGLKSIRWTTDTNTKSSNRSPSATAKDIVFVHLYLSDISHFARINKYYKDFFGIVLPPSRSCVAVGKHVLTGGRRVMMDCMIQRGSGEYMRILPDANIDEFNSLSVANAQFIREHRANPHHVLRSTLHVQTISHWAPVCVGPYSQANILRSSLIFMAGQIGLNAGTMTLVKGGWKQQMSQSWKNAASVLDALEGSLNDVLCGVVYVGSENVLKKGRSEMNQQSESAIRNQVWQECELICRNCIAENGGIIAGRVDELKSSESDALYGGFEDYETYKEIMGMQESEKECIQESSTGANIPLLMVALPAMPVKAESEVELICATHRASACLKIETFTISYNESPNGNDEILSEATTNLQSDNNINWDTGFDGIDHDSVPGIEPTTSKSDITINSAIRSIGDGCAAIAFTTASHPNPIKHLSFDIYSVLLDMVECTVSSIEKSSGLGKSYALHIRLFYSCSAGNDGATIRNALHTTIGSAWGGNSLPGRKSQVPAISLVPVKAMHLSPSLSSVSSSSPFLAMQTTVMDLVHTETEMWIHHNRDNMN